MSNAPASTGPAANVGTIVSALLSGDGTYSLSGSRYTGSGIIVALPEFGGVIDSEVANETEAIVASWVANNAHAITGNPAPFFRPRYFGIWTDPDSDIVYLDIVEAFPREEYDEAIAAGIARDQIAIWDNGRQELIETGGTGAVE